CRLNHVVVRIVSNARSSPQRVASPDRPVQLVVGISRRVASLVRQRDQLASIVVAELDLAAETVGYHANLTSVIVRVTHRAARWRDVPGYFVIQIVFDPADSGYRVGD